MEKEDARPEIDDDRLNEWWVNFLASKKLTHYSARDHLDRICEEIRTEKLEEKDIEISRETYIKCGFPVEEIEGRLSKYKEVSDDSGILNASCYRHKTEGIYEVLEIIKDFVDEAVLLMLENVPVKAQESDSDLAIIKSKIEQAINYFKYQLKVKKQILDLELSLANGGFLVTTSNLEGAIKEIRIILNSLHRILEQNEEADEVYKEE